MKKKLEVNCWGFRLAVVFIVLQCLALSGSWAADSTVPPFTWKYTFTLPQDQVSKLDKNIQKAAAKNNATVAYAVQEKGGKTAVQVVLDGSYTTAAQLNDIILGANAGIKTLVDQPTKVSIKGLVAKQSPISLVLTSNITTGSQWKLDTSSLAIVEGNATGAYEQTSPLLGAAGRQTFVLTPLVNGNVAILINYGRHWETTAEDPGTLDIQVNGSLPQTLDLSAPVATPVPAPPIDQVTQDSSTQVTGMSTPLLGLPISYDLRPSMTSVKHQQSCGSCWAFATVGVLEGLLTIRTGATVDLSEQFLVSCNKNNWSCNGGLFAHDYHKSTLGTLQSVAGAVLEADKPYSASDGTCTPISNHPYSVSSWGYVGTSNTVAATDAIKNAIFTYGPVAAAVCAGSAFSGYSGGVFNTNEASVCGGSNSGNHAIVLVGWDDGTQTWLLRNSWGTGWGESGYMRIKWGTSNVGLAANYASYGNNTCTYGIGSTSASVATAGGAGSISVTSQNSCAWTASSNASWISILSGSSGSGSGVVTYSLSPNSGSLRTGTITAAGQSFTVTQQGTASCTYTTSPTSISTSALGLTGNINITTQSGCAWSTSNTLGWASIVSGSSGTGSGTVVYSVSPNTGSARTGALTIAGQTIGITQQAATQCTYSLNSLSNSFNSSGGSGTVNLLTQAGCAWTAARAASWLTIVSGSSGTGSGTVSYSVSANLSTASRSGTLSIGGQTFTVNQSGASQGGDAQLSNGVALTGQTLASSVSQGAWKYYSFTVPSGASNLVIDLYGLGGDLDLFGRQGNKPTSDIFDCVSYRTSTYSEQCVITSPAAGTWWVGVNNYDIGTIGYSIKVSWGASDTQLASGIAASGSVASSPTMIWKYFYIDVPSGATRLVTDLYNLTGDADVYLKYGSKPDISSVDECDSQNAGTTSEQCDITSPAAGRWWLAVVNYDPTASYSVKATTSSGGGTITPGSIGTLITRYRLYSDVTKEHLYTTDTNEYSVLAIRGWVAEGAIYQLYGGAGSLNGVAAVPFYRLYNPISYQHHWTTDANEYNVLGQGDWLREGVDGYILPFSVVGSMPVYRLYLNAFGGLHLWTTDLNEKSVLSTSRGWVDEGVAGYVVPLP
jgi:C1A family cysteine protease